MFIVLLVVQKTFLIVQSVYGMYKIYSKLHNVCEIFEYIFIFVKNKVITFFDVV